MLKQVRRIGRMPGVLAVFFGLTLLLAGVLSAQPVSEVQSSVDDRAIERLLDELGNDSFAARQAAMKKIWRSPDITTETLRRYARTADPEAAERINRIIEHFEMGITPETDPEVARLVFAFYRADDDRKFVIMHQLRDAGHHKLVMDLLMAIKDPSMRGYLSQNAYESGEELVGYLMPNGFDGNRIAGLDVLMDHAYMWTSHPEDCAMYWHLRGQSSSRIDHLTGLADAGSITDEQLTRLVTYFRLAGEPTRALPFARQLAAELQPQIIQRLLLEAGDWPELAKTYRPELEYDEGLIASQCKKAMFSCWAGDKKGFASSVDEISKHVGDNKHLKREAANARAILGLAALDPELLVSEIDRMSPSLAFRVLGHVQKYDQAFRLLEAPREFPEIKKWYRKKVRSLQRLLNNYEIRDSTEDLVEAIDLFSFLRYYTEHTGSLKDVSQAVELYELLAEGVKINGDFYRNWNVKIFEDVALQNVGEEIWHFFDILGMDLEIEQAANAIFPDCPTTAGAWLYILEDTIPDPVDRCKLLAVLLKSPFADEASRRNPDVEYLVGIAREYIANLQPENKATFLYEVGETCRVLGYESLAQDLWLESGYQGDGLALSGFGDIAVKTGDWEDAKRWFEQAAEVEPAGYGRYKAALCDMKLGNETEAREVIRQLRILSLHSYDLYRLCFEVYEIGFTEDAIELIQAYLRGTGYYQIEMYYQYQFLATMMGDIDAGMSARYWATSLHFYLSYLDVSADSGIRYHYLAMQHHKSLARQQLQEGKTQLAFDTMIRCSKMASSSSSLAENMVPLLEQAEQPEKADELFELIANRYIEVLEAYPNSALHHNNYAWACARCKRRLTDSLWHAERAVELEPRNTSYLDTLAEVAFLQGDIEKATELSRKCLELNPFKEHYREQLERFEAAR